MQSNSEKECLIEHAHVNTRCLPSKAGHAEVMRVLTQMRNGSEHGSDRQALSHDFFLFQTTSRTTGERGSAKLYLQIWGCMETDSRSMKPLLAGYGAD